MYSIPTSRKIDWSDAGCDTDYSTDRTTIYTTINPEDCDGDGNCAPEIETALANCPAGQVVKLGAGTFPISTTIYWDESEVTLRGSGKDSTILEGQAGFSGSHFFYISNGANPWEGVSAKTLTSTGLTKGSTQINTSTAHGWSEGDYILIDQDNDEGGDPPWDDLGASGECNWCSRLSGERVLGQVVKVTNVVDTDTVDIDPPLYFSYDTGQSAQGIECVGIVEKISIESLKIDNTDSDATQTMTLVFLFDSLFYDLDITGAISKHFWFYGTLKNTIRHSIIHTAQGEEATAGYGIFLGLGSSANLIEDNIFHTLVTGVCFEGAAAGNVVAYNHTDNSIISSPSTNRLMIIGHGAGSYMNLVESNFIEGRFRSDNIWGTQHYFTIFRNRIEQIADCDNQPWAFDLEYHNQYSNVIGNILGTDGYETEYEEENDDIGFQVKAIYRLGYVNITDTTAAGNDPAVKSTMLRHYNYDYVTDGTKVCDDSGEPGCQGGDADIDLPDSLYLASKPSWWDDQGAGRPWPCIGPDITGKDETHVTDIPAKDRYEDEQYQAQSQLALILA